MTANVLKNKLSLRLKRKKRVRAKISGSSDCPRVSIFKSNRTIYVQAIEDINGNTLCVSDGKVLNIKSNKEGAAILAKDLASKLKEKGIEKVVFDRNGYIYHGVVASFVDALKNNGIKL